MINNLGLDLLRWRIGRFLTRRFPPFLYSSIFTVYWRIHPKRQNATLISKGDKILVKKNDIEYFNPSKQLIEGFETRSYKWFCSLDEGDIAIDAGAAMGRDTLTMAKEVGESGKIVAIEPVPSNLDLLKQNLELNGLENVLVVEKALWSGKGKAEIFITDEFLVHSLIEREIIPEILGKIEVRTDSLDGILSDLDLKDEPMSLIKMDIEGAEIEALKGSKRTLENTERVLVEIHKGDKFDSTEGVKGFLDSAGFEIVQREHFLFAKK